MFRKITIAIASITALSVLMAMLSMVLDEDDALAQQPYSEAAKLPLQVHVQKSTIKDFKVGESGIFASDLIYIDNNLGVWIIPERSVIDKPSIFSFIVATREIDGFHIEIYPSSDGQHNKWEAGDKDALTLRLWNWIPTKSVEIKTFEEQSKLK